MAITFTPGQTISWDELNALLAQHGSPNGAKSVVKVERKPLTKEEREKIEDAGGDPDAPEQNPTYRYFVEDGSWIDVAADTQGQPDAQGRPSQGSTFRVADYHPSTKFTQAQTKAEAAAPESQTPAQRRTAREEAEIERNRNLPPDQDPRAETDAERAARADARIKEQGATASAQTQKDDTTIVGVEYTGTGQARQKVTTYKSGRKVPEPAPTNATAKGVTYEADGTKVTTYDDGSTTREQLSPAQQRAEREARQATKATKPVQGKDGKQYTEVTETDPVKGTKRTYYTDETGKEVPLPGDPLTNIKGVPSYTPDLTKPGAGLIDRAKQLDELVAAGTITYQQRQDVLKNDQVLASTVANEFNVGVSILREDYQNQTSQRNADVSTANTRLQIANSHMQNALGLVTKFGQYLGAKPGLAGEMFVGLLATQVAHATAMGGLKDIPREHMDPTVMGAARRMVAGAAGPQPTPPNAIGAGAVPSSIQPAQAPATAVGLPRNLFDPMPAGAAGTGVSQTTDAGGVPREFTPASSTGPNPVSGLLGPAPQVPQPEDASWRQQAIDRQAVAMGQNLMGDQGSPFQLPDMPEPTGTDFAPLPMVLDSSIPGLTPEMDAQAKKEIDMAIAGGHY